MRYITTISVFVLIMITNLGCHERTIEQHLADFDRAFIPMQYYAETGNMPRAKSAAFYLEYQWQRLKKQPQLVKLSTEEWLFVVTRMQRWLDQVYTNVDANQAALTSIYLDHANYELRAFRQRNGIDYYLDYLYELQDEVEILDEVAQDEMLCLLELNEFKTLHKNVVTKWEIFRAQLFQQTSFQLSTEHKEQFITAYIVMNEQMDVLDEQMECADRGVVANVTYALRMDVLRLLQPFGNFDASKVYYAQDYALRNSD